MFNLTETEVSQYIRLTLKEWGLNHISVEWNEKMNYAIGLAIPWKNKIQLSPKILCSFFTFRQTFLHEVAHIIQWERNGKTFKNEKGRNDFHGKLFKQICKELKIPSDTRIPIF